MTTQRHSWSEPVRYIRKTERVCDHCGIVKVTRHEEYVWTEFWRDGAQIKMFGERTPVCDMPAKPKEPPAPIPDFPFDKSRSEHGGTSS